MIQNNTENVVIHKVWILEVTKVKPNHLVFLKSNNISARFVQPESKSFELGFRTFQYAIQSGMAEFETISADQEATLKLLYGTDLILKTMYVMTPNSYIT